MFCFVRFDLGQAVSKPSKMVLFLSSLLSDQLPLKTTLFGGSRFPCVPHSVFPIIRPRDRPSWKAWWILSTIVKRRVAMVIGFFVPLTYNYHGSLPCNGC